jgi:uncharacterized membrane protein YbhN (UPF0104 family)
MDRHEPKTNGKRKRARLTAAGQISLAVFLLWIISRKIDLGSMWSALRETDGFAFFGLVAVFLFAKFLYAWQMRRELSGHGIRMGVGKLMKVYLAISFYSLAISGDVAAGGITWMKLGREAGAWAQSGVSILYLRLLNLLLLFIAGLAGVMCDPFLMGSRFRPVFVLAVAASCVFLAPFFSPAVARALESIIGGRTFAFAAKIGGFAVRDRLRAVVREFPNHARAGLLVNVMLTLLIHGCSVLMLYMAAKGLSLDVPIPVLLWLCPVLTVINLFPFAFGGLGVREGVLLLLLSPYALSGPQIVAFSLLNYTVSFIAGGVLGGLCEAQDVFFAHGRDKKKMTNPTTTERQVDNAAG